MAKTKKKGPPPKRKPPMTQRQRYERAKRDILGKKDNKALSKKENEKSQFWHYFFVFLIAMFAAEILQTVFSLSWGLTFALALAFVFIAEIFVTKVLKK